ncbi:REBL1 GTPase, partial [Sylvia borin]|nr:REBL1 GTPase [Sylvia borin]
RKVFILGYRARGKTSMAHQFVEGKFVECYEPTVESTLPATGFISPSSQDKYTILPHSFTIGIHSYVLVYSVTSLQSFQMVKTLHSKLYESWGKTMPVVLLGNKTDPTEVKGVLGVLCVKRLAESWGAILLESSAKESQVTMGIFMKLIEEINQVGNSYGRSTSCCLM